MFSNVACLNNTRSSSLRSARYRSRAMIQGSSIGSVCAAGAVPVAIWSAESALGKRFSISSNDLSRLKANEENEHRKISRVKDRTVAQPRFAEALIVYPLPCPHERLKKLVKCRDIDCT